MSEEIIKQGPKTIFGLSEEIESLRRERLMLQEALEMFVKHYNSLPDDTLVGTGLTNEPFFKAKEILSKLKGAENIG